MAGEAAFSIVISPPEEPEKPSVHAPQDILLISVPSTIQKSNSSAIFENRCELNLFSHIHQDRKGYLLPPVATHTAEVWVEAQDIAAKSTDQRNAHNISWQQVM